MSSVIQRFEVSPTAIEAVDESARARLLYMKYVHLWFPCHIKKELKAYRRYIYIAINQPG